MGSSLDTVQFICDQAGPGLALTYRRMFGEFALYLDGKVVALVCDDQLFLKPTPEGRQFLGRVPEGSPYPGCRPFLVLTAGLDDPERLAGALRVTADALPMPKPRAKTRTMTKTKTAPTKPTPAQRAARADNAPVRTVRVKLHMGAMSSIPVPFDPKAVFGKVRAPVRVTLNGYTYRSTVCVMQGRVFIPLRASHREAAGVDGTEKLEVRIALDGAARVVKPPADLLAALRKRGFLDRWKQLSYTHQREHVEAIEAARKPDTRARRIAAAMTMLAATNHRSTRRR